MTLYGIGFMLFSQVESVITFYLAFALMAVGSSLGGLQPSWWPSSVGFKDIAPAVALSSLGFSLGGLCVPIVVLALGHGAGERRIHIRRHNFGRRHSASQPDSTPAANVWRGAGWLGTGNGLASRRSTDADAS